MVVDNFLFGPSCLNLCLRWVVTYYGSVPHEVIFWEVLNFIKAKKAVTHLDPQIMYFVYDLR